MTHSVVFGPDAEKQLVALYRHLAVAATPGIAAEYTDAIVAFCEGLQTFPQRGSRRDDIRPGLRIIGFRRRVAIAFAVDGATVTILGVFYGGQDHEAALRADIDPSDG